MTASSAQGSFRPERPWPRHDGTSGEADADYLVPPHPVIGPVISADTNRGRGGFHSIDWALKRKVIEVGLLALLLGGTLGALLVHASSPADLLPWTTGLGAARKVAVFVAAVGCALVSILTALALRSRRASYVGQRGLQSHAKAPLGGPKRQVMRFEDSARLQIERTRHFFNGAYTHTSYEYRWVDARGIPTFLIGGTYDDRVAPRSSNPLLFALAAERAWLSRR